MIKLVIIFLIGVIVGFLIAAFVGGAGRKNKEEDYYNEGYADGFADGKAKYDK